MHGKGTLSCSTYVENLQYLHDSMTSMKKQLRSATEVLGVPGVSWSVGASVFFGLRTLLACLHGLNAEFWAALSWSDADIESIRATNYELPMQFISSADQEPVRSYKDIESYPHPGTAILFGCPKTALAESREGLLNKCVTDEHMLAYVLGNMVLLGLTKVIEIMLCPFFFKHAVLKENDSVHEAMMFKAAFKHIVQGQNPRLDYESYEGGA